MDESEKEKIRRLFEEMSGKLPQGFYSASKNIDMFVDEFAGHIAGHVTTFLDGKRVDPQKINIGSDIDKKLNKSMQKIVELIEYKNKWNEIARLLIDYLKKNP